MSATILYSLTERTHQQFKEEINELLENIDPPDRRLLCEVYQVLTGKRAEMIEGEDDDTFVIEKAIMVSDHDSGHEWPAETFFRMRLDLRLAGKPHGYKEVSRELQSKPESTIE